MVELVAEAQVPGREHRGHPPVPHGRHVQKPPERFLRFPLGFVAIAGQDRPRQESGKAQEKGQGDAGHLDLW